MTVVTYLFAMSTPEATRMGETTTTNEHDENRRRMTNPDGPATPGQKAALRKFGCEIPPTLTKIGASDWMDALVGKARAGATITPDDLAGPPTFTRASEIAREGPKSPPVASPAPAPASPPVPAPEGPEPTGTETETPEYLPTSDAWGTVEMEFEQDADGNLTTRRFYAKVASHPAPGESWDQLLERIGNAANDAVVKRAAKP